VLIAMGRSPEEAHASVRFSLGESNDTEDVERILAVTPRVVERLRALAGSAGSGVAGDDRKLETGAR
jgi:cysteine desulfurase